MGTEAHARPHRPQGARVPAERRSLATRRIAALAPDVVHVQWLGFPRFDRLWLRRVARTTGRPSSPPTRSCRRVPPTRWTSGGTSSPPSTASSSTPRAPASGSPSSASTRPRSSRSRTRPSRAPTGRRSRRRPGRRSSSSGSSGSTRASTSSSARCREVVGAVPEARLVVAGDPLEPVEPLRDLAASLGVADRIEWRLGYVPGDRIPALMAEATVVVLPYRRIEASGVLADAVGHGRPGRRQRRRRDRRGRAPLRRGGGRAAGGPRRARRRLRPPPRRREPAWPPPSPASRPHGGPSPGTPPPRRTSGSTTRSAASRCCRTSSSSAPTRAARPRSRRRCARTRRSSCRRRGRASSPSTRHRRSTARSRPAPSATGRPTRRSSQARPRARCAARSRRSTSPTRGRAAASAPACPRRKLVAVLRNPVERAFSDYLMYVRDGDERLDFGAALDEQDERRRAGSPTGFYLETGFYGRQLRPTSTRSRASSSRCTSSRTSPPTRTPCSAPDLRASSASTRRSGRRPSGRSTSPASRATPLVGAAVRGGRRVAPLLPEAVRRRAKAALARGLDRPALEPELRARLVEVYREDVAELERLLERPLGHWLAPAKRSWRGRGT